jgi:nitroreductase
MEVIVNMEVMEAIKTRRSVRQYRSTPVSEKDLQAVMEAACWAPSWANTQCWRFVVVLDPEKKSQIAGTMGSGNRGAGAIMEAPVLIIACAELGKSGYFGGKSVTDKGDWYMFDVALAMQNLVLAAQSLGLGTVHIGYFDASKAAELIQLPEGFVVVEMTPLGYPNEDPEVKSRREIHESIFYEVYGQR